MELEALIDWVVGMLVWLSGTLFGLMLAKYISTRETEEESEDLDEDWDD